MIIRKLIISAIDNRCRLEDERKENKRLNEDNLKLIRESEIDELTGIYNRLAFRRRYDRMYKYALRNAHTYCMGILDIDFFKVYNDSYGHIRGDKCLKQADKMLYEVKQAGKDDYKISELVYFIKK